MLEDWIFGSSCFLPLPKSPAGHKPQLLWFAAPSANLWWGVHHQPGLCNHQKLPKGRAGKVRSSHAARPPCALGNALDVLRLTEKAKDLGMLVSPFTTQPRTSRFSALPSAAALGRACASHSGSSEARPARRGAVELAAPSDISARPPASVAMAMRVWG